MGSATRMPFFSSPPQLRRGGAERRGGADQRNDFIDQHHLSLGLYLMLRPIGLALRGRGSALLS
jgi:hypothetical protein